MASGADTIKGLYEAFTRGDVAAVLGAFAPDIHWMEAENFLYADRNPYRSPQAVAEGVFARIAADVENFAVRPSRIIDGGDTIAVEGRYQGTIKATGVPVDAQFVHVWQLLGGKVVGFQQYTDTRQWSEAVAVKAAGV